MLERERGPVKFEIVKHFGVLSTAQTGWTKEFNLVRWNDRPEKYDIRDWAPGHERMSKGVTLYDYEMKKVVELCEGFFVGLPGDESAAEVPLGEKELPDRETQTSSSELYSADQVAEDKIPF